MNGLLVFLIILNAYILAVYLMARWGILARYNIGLLGPALMFRTTRGRTLINKIAQARRFFVASGTFGIWLTLGAMFALTALLIWQIPLLFQIPEGQAPGAREILAIPGINPLIPIGYGIFALIVAIVIHEFSHGILARAQDLKVKSLGVLFLIVPIGAFVEPDEDELKATGRKRRMRVFAAGPTSNLVTALICGLVFSMGFVGAAEPVADGVGVVAVVPESPADQAGIEEGWLITHIDGQRVPDYQAFLDVMGNTTPGQEVTIGTARHGTHTVCLGDREQFNGTEPEPGTDFCSLGDGGGQAAADNATSADGDDATAADGNGTTGRDDTDNNTTAAAGQDGGFLGIQSLPFSPARLKEILQYPLANLQHFVFYVAMPFTGLTPMNAPLTDFYEVPASALGLDWLGFPGIGDGLAVALYWIVANMFYWLMWISLMLGLTNALPAVPLDGGYIFRDFVDGLMHRLRPQSTEAQREPFVKKSSVAISFMILGLILLQFIAPRVAKYIF